VKFLADMNISPQTVDFLISLGYDATHLSQEGLHHLSDPLIIKKALSEERVIITHDLDFGELVAAGGLVLPSVITLRLRNMAPDRVNQVMEQIIQHHLPTLRQGVLITVTENRIRIRQLPVK